MNQAETFKTKKAHAMCKELFHLNTLFVLLGQNLDYFGFVLGVQNLSAFIGRLKQQAHFSKELQMRASFVDWRKCHNEYTARLLVEAVEINRFSGNTDAGHKV